MRKRWKVDIDGIAERKRNIVVGKRLWSGRRLVHRRNTE
jgi:hypothetical protein